MATIKAYTDIEQSRKLAEILPLKSADMFYSDIFIDKKHKYNFHYLETYGFKTFEDTKARESAHLGFIPCWSLTALLSVLPEIQGGKPVIALDDNYITYPHMSDLHTKSDSLIDCCVEMIIKLKERNLL